MFYLTPAWSPWTEANKETLKKVQRRAVKMVSDLAGSSYEDRLAKLGMITMSERCNQTDIIQQFVK